MKFFTLFIAFSLSATLFSQQEYSFTNYFELNSFFNPASTGTDGSPSITGITRKQWVGLEGSPFTGGLLYESKLASYNMGLGGYIFTDFIGATNMTNIAFNYSYSLKLNEDNFIAFGIDAGVDLYSTDYDRLVYWDEDNLFDGQKQNATIPRAGIGVQYYTQNLYIGVSVPRLLSYNNPSGIGISSVNLPSTTSNYIINAGYKFELNKEFDFQANILGKYTPRIIPQGDINVMCTYKKQIGIGVGYKSLGFASTYLHYTYGSVVRIGYAFDFTLTKMANYSSGSHELFIKYMFKSKKIKKSPSSII